MTRPRAHEPAQRLKDAARAEGGRFVFGSGIGSLAHETLRLAGSKPETTMTGAFQNTGYKELLVRSAREGDAPAAWS